MIDLLSKWPLVRQIREGKDGTGLRIDVGQNACDACADRQCESGALDLPILRRRLRPADLSQGRETDFDRRRSGTPISQGNLCPKGAASYQLLTHSRRETKMKYRAPRAKEWTEISLDRAMDMVADRVWESRKRTFVHKTKMARRSITRPRSVISAAPRSITKRIISFENYSLSAWGWSAYPTRRGYDIAARCPVWAPPLAGAELRPRNKISPTPIAF